MKRLLLLILLIPLLAKTQVIIPRSPFSVIPTDANIFVTNNLKIPRYVDTAHANTYMAKDSLGLFMYVPGLGTYVRDTVAGLAAHKWTLIAGTGGAVSSVFGRTGAVVAATGDYASFYPVLAGSYSDPSWINTLSAAKISGAGALTATSSKITLTGTPGVALLTGVGIDVNQANLALSAIGGSLGIAQINATGVPSSTTFLRGDGTWASASGGTTYTADETSIHLASTVFGIKSTWVGQTSLTTLGTITTGVWNGTAIANANLANSSITINGVSTSLGGSTSVTDATLSTSNITTNNVSTSKHGFAPILPNDATKYLDGTGAYSVPAGSGGGGVSTPSNQSYTSGTTLTQTTGANYIQINPSTTQSTLTVTSATSANWHNSNDLFIVVGGTIPNGTVITTFSFVAGSGLTLIDDIPANTLMAAHRLHYHLIGTIIYRMKD